MQGSIRRVAADVDGGPWLAAGTARGFVATWDMRFRVCIGSWRCGRNGVLDMAMAVAHPDKLGLGHTSGSPLLYVAAGDNQVGLWDVQARRRLQILDATPRVRVTEPTPTVDRADRLDRHLAVAEVRRLAEPAGPTCRALLPTPEGPLLSGGSDRVVRLWDALRPSDSYQVLYRRCLGEPRVTALMA